MNCLQYDDFCSERVNNPFTPRVSYGDIKVILTFESVDEILWCDHSNETSSAVLSHGTTVPLESIGA